jgi:hypothetical protein
MVKRIGRIVLRIDAGMTLAGKPKPGNGGFPGIDGGDYGMVTGFDPCQTKKNSEYELRWKRYFHESGIIVIHDKPLNFRTYFLESPLTNCAVFSSFIEKGQ